MPAFLPLSFPATAVPVNPQPNAMSPLTSAYQLAGISDKLKKSLPPNVKASDHSIPHIGAYIEYLRSEVLHDQRSDYVAAWRGVLSMIGLSKLYGYNLSIQTVNMTAPPVMVNGRVSPGPIYKKELERLNLLDAKSSYYVIFRTLTWNGMEVTLPLAVVDPFLLIVPFKNIDPRAVADVPWYNAQYAAWYDLAAGAATATPQQKAEYRQLAAWLNNQHAAAKAANKPGLAKALYAWAQDLLCGTSMVSLDHSYQISAVGNIADHFGAFDRAAFVTVPDYAVSINGSIFTQRVVLTHVSQLSATTAWNCNVSDTSGAPLAVLPPLSAQFADLLDRNLTGSGLLELQSINIKDEFVANNRIQVEVIFRNGSLTVSRKQVFEGEQIVYIENFPYICMWPYVNLPAGHWRYYTVNMVQHTNIAPPPSNCAVVNPQRNRLSFVQQSGVSLTQVEPRDDNKAISPMRISQNFPAFVPLQYTDDLGSSWECGCLLAQPPHDLVHVTKGGTMEATACIDFGTSNTVCVVKAGPAQTHKVLNGSRVHALVSFTGADGADDEINNYHRFHGVSKSTREAKFPSVAQLYANSDASEPLRNGQILLADGGIIDHFALMDTNLQAVGIYTYLKSDTASPLAIINTAVEVFVKHLTLLCALEAKLMGATAIQYCFSYPNAKYMSNLSNYWGSAIAYIRSMRIFNQVRDPLALTERMAAAYHVRNNMLTASDMASVTPGFAVVDIGGGTSDMTVWRAPFASNDPIWRGDTKLYERVMHTLKPGQDVPAIQGGNLSFRYAGNQLFSHTFFTYFRSHLDVMPTIFPRLFHLSPSDVTEGADTTGGYAPFASAEAKARTIGTVTNYINSIKKVPSLLHEGFPALTTMLNSLLDDPGIDEVFWNTPACEELRTIISFKLKGILYVLGLLIGECCGIHPSPESGTFFIYLVGGGSQAYRLANGGFNSSAYDMLAELPKLQFPAYENFGTMRDRFAIKPSNSQKIEVVDGMLSYNTDSATRPPKDVVPSVPFVSDNVEYATLHNAYSYFIHFAVESDPDLQGLLPRLELIPPSANRDEQQRDVYLHYMNTFTNIWRDLKSSLDGDVSPTLQEAIYSVLMAEELLS